MTLTKSRVSSQVQEAADFVMRTRHWLPIDHPSLAKAEAVLRSAGVWCASDLAEPPTECPEIALVPVGMFDANGRRRTVFQVQVAGIEIGTAVHWENGHTRYPWSLDLPAPGIRRGCRDSAEVLRVVKSFVWPGF